MNNVKRVLSAAMIASLLGTAGAATAFGNTATPIDAARDGNATVTVTKHARTDTNGVTPGMGNQLQNVDGDTLAGAVFTMKQVKSIGDVDLTKIDLKTNEGWKKLAGTLDANNQPKGKVVYDEASARTLTTAGDGVAKFDNLKFGLYYVEETKAPEGASPAAPFYITAPLWFADTAEAAGGQLVVTKSIAETSVDTSDNSVSLTVTNYKQGELPKFGHGGVASVLGASILFMLLALALFISNRKHS